jgi:hypothetical protein
MAIPRRDMDPEDHIHDHVHDHDAVLPASSTTTGVATRTEMTTVPFGLAQIVMLSVGIFLTVLGTIGLARSGIDTWTTPRMGIGAFTMTPLMAAFFLGAGIVCLASAASRGSARSTAMVLGPVMIAGGIVVMLQPIADLGTNRADGILLIVAGVLALLGAMATPVVAFRSEERDVVTR